MGLQLFEKTRLGRGPATRSSWKLTFSHPLREKHWLSPRWGTWSSGSRESDVGVELNEEARENGGVYPRMMVRKQKEEERE